MKPGAPPIVANAAKRQLKKAPLVNSRELMNKASRFAYFIDQEGITTHELISELKRSKSTISKYRNGYLLAPQDVLVYLQKKYGMNPNWYHTGNGKRKLSEENSQSKKLYDVANMFVTISNQGAMIDSLQKQVFNLLEAQQQLRSELNDLKVKLNTR